MTDNVFTKQARERVEKTEKNIAMLTLLRDLNYPQSKDGSTLDISLFKTIIAWHLVRCGWRPCEDKRVIKPRRIIAKGVAGDAVEWVGVDEPDDIDYSTLTLAQVNKLSPVQRALAMRAMGGPETPDLPDNPGWRVKPSISITDEPDTDDDGFAWTVDRGVKP